MVQARICSFYANRCSHVKHTITSFLDLPEDLRDRIYGEAGVISGALLRLCSDLVPEEIRERCCYFRSSSCPHLYFTRGQHGAFFACAASEDFYYEEESTTLFLNLSLSNSHVSTDVARFIYSHNEILFCCEDYTELEMLLHPRFGWLNSIRCLTIHISPTYAYSLADGSCYHRACSGKQRVLKSTSSTFAIRMRTWCKVVKRLASSVRSNTSKLELRILCNVDSIVTAREVVQPLKDYGLPVSTVRLGDSSDTCLTSIARDAVLNTNSTREELFLFLQLPTEVRQLILRFTDLVTPAREVRWYEDCQFGEFHRPLERDLSLRHYCYEFCGNKSAVYPHCGAWHPPVSLLTVCKAMLEDARAVFFSENRFIMNVDFRQPGWVRPGPSAYRYDFLRKLVPTSALSHLRSLEIIFPATQYDFAGGDKDAYRLWIAGIDYLAPRLKKLSLRLYMTHYAGETRDEFDAYEIVDAIPIADIQRLFHVQKQIVHPLAKISTIHSCYVRAMTPWQLHRATPGQITEERLQAQEECLERLVMGSGYDSIAAGKLEQRQSEWTKRYED